MFCSTNFVEREVFTQFEWTEARAMIDGDREFGRWCSQNFWEQNIETLRLLRIRFEVFGARQDEMRRFPSFPVTVWGRSTVSFEAAAKTATGIIEQGLAVLKIKQGCARKQGGSHFPEVAMRLLGLSYRTAKMFAKIGAEAEKLGNHGSLLPGESMTTIYRIACMPPEVIADKIERGVITPTATRAQVLEKIIVTTSRTVASAEDDVVTSIKDIVGKLRQ